MNNEEVEKFNKEQEQIAAYSRAMIDIVYNNMIEHLTEEQANAINYFFVNGTEEEKNELVNGLIELYGPEIKTEDILTDLTDNDD